MIPQEYKKQSIIEDIILRPPKFKRGSRERKLCDCIGLIEILYKNIYGGHFYINDKEFNKEIFDGFKITDTPDFFDVMFTRGETFFHLGIFLGEDKILNMRTEGIKISNLKEFKNKIIWLRKI